MKPTVKLMAGLIVLASALAQANEITKVTNYRKGTIHIYKTTEKPDGKGYFSRVEETVCSKEIAIPVFEVKVGEYVSLGQNASASSCDVEILGVKMQALVMSYIIKGQARGKLIANSNLYTAYSAGLIISPRAGSTKPKTEKELEELRQLAKVSSIAQKPINTQVITYNWNVQPLTLSFHPDTPSCPNGAALCSTEYFHGQVTFQETK